jgi:hypothetical protein
MPRPKLLEQLSIGDIQKLLKNKLAHLEALQSRRRELQQQLHDTERQIRRAQGGLRGRSLSLSFGGSGRRMPRNERPVKEYIREVLAQHRKGLRPNELADAVLAAGYQTNSAKFYVIVYQSLKKMLQEGVVERDEASRTYRLAKS